MPLSLRAPSPAVLTSTTKRMLRVKRAIEFAPCFAYQLDLWYQGRWQAMGISDRNDLLARLRGIAFLQPEVAELMCRTAFRTGEAIAEIDWPE